MTTIRNIKAPKATGDARGPSYVWAMYRAFVVDGIQAQYFREMTVHEYEPRTLAAYRLRMMRARVRREIANLTGAPA